VSKIVASESEKGAPLTQEELRDLELDQPTYLEAGDVPPPVAEAAPPPAAPSPATEDERIHQMIAAGVEAAIARMVSSPRVARTHKIEKEVVERDERNRIKRVVETHHVEE